MTPYIPRNLEKKVSQLSTFLRVVFIDGARKAGKTAMLKKLMKEGAPRNYVTLDDWEERSLAQKDPKLFLQIHKPPVLIEEVQHAPNLFSRFKIYADEHPDEVGAIWLTSSHMYGLMRGVEESMAGRVGLLTLAPLSISELLGRENRVFTVDFDALSSRAKNAKEGALACQKLLKEGIPGAYLSESRDDYYSDYLSSVLEKEVKSLAKSVDILVFYRFLLALAKRTTQLVNVAALAKEAGINPKQAADWLELLETLGIVFRIGRDFMGGFNRITKKEKIYFYDTGFVDYLIKIGSRYESDVTPSEDALFENLAVSEIVKSLLAGGRSVWLSLSYYKNKDGKEITLLYEANQTFYPILVKRTEKVTPEMARVFSVLDKGDLPRGDGVIISLDPEARRLDENNFTAPIWAI